MEALAFIECDPEVGGADFDVLATSDVPHGLIAQVERKSDLLARGLQTAGAGDLDFGTEVADEVDLALDDLGVAAGFQIRYLADIGAIVDAAGRDLLIEVERMARENVNIDEHDVVLFCLGDPPEILYQLM